MSASPRHLVFPLALVVALALGACGSSNDNSSSSTSTPAATTEATTTAAATTPAASGGETVKLSADAGGALKFNTTKLKAKAGKVTLDLTNPAPIPHAIAVEGNGVDKDGESATTGGHSTVTVTLKPGTYTFYCPVPGHEAGGMKGTLTVS
jgi:plastocyanin